MKTRLGRFVLNMTVLWLFGLWSPLEPVAWAPVTSVVIWAGYAVVALRLFRVPAMFRGLQVKPRR